MSDLTGTQASTQIEAARQAKLDDFRKNAAFTALTQTYGPAAGDPEAWDQAQAAQASAQETPGKVQAQTLENQNTQRTQQQQNLYRAAQLYGSTLGPDGSGDPAAYDKLFNNPLVQQATGLNPDQVQQAKQIFTGPGARDRLQQFQKAMIGPQPLTGAFSYGTDQQGNSVAIGHDKFGNPIVQPLNGVTPTVVQNAQSGAANRASLQQNRAVLPNGQVNQPYVDAKTQIAKAAGDAGVNLTPAALEMAAQQYAKSGVLPNFGYGKQGAALRTQIANKTAADSPDGAPDLASNAQAYKTRQVAMSDLAKSAPTSAGGLVRSAGAVLQHIDTLDQFIGALQNKNLPLANSISQRFKQETGQSAPTNFDLQKQIVSSELLKFLQGGRSTLGDRQEIQASISKANSPAQLRHAIMTLKADLGAQLGSQYAQFEGVGAGKEYLRTLTPAARFMITGVAEPGAHVAPQAHPPAGKGGVVDYRSYFGAH